jgi:hypothetical protein
VRLPPAQREQIQFQREQIARQRQALELQQAEAIGGAVSDVSQGACSIRGC